jgi:hypothetical protein
MDFTKGNIEVASIRKVAELSRKWGIYIEQEYFASPSSSVLFYVRDRGSMFLVGDGVDVIVFDAKGKHNETITPKDRERFISLYERTREIDKLKSYAEIALSHFRYALKVVIFADRVDLLVIYPPVEALRVLIPFDCMENHKIRRYASKVIRSQYLEKWCKPTLYYKSGILTVLHGPISGFQVRLNLECDWNERRREARNITPPEDIDSATSVEIDESGVR